MGQDFGICRRSRYRAWRRLGGPPLSSRLATGGTCPPSLASREVPVPSPARTALLRSAASVNAASSALASIVPVGEDRPICLSFYRELKVTCGVLAEQFIGSRTITGRQVPESKELTSTSPDLPNGHPRVPSGSPTSTRAGGPSLGGQVAPADWLRRFDPVVSRRLLRGLVDGRRAGL